MPKNVTSVLNRSQFEKAPASLHQKKVPNTPSALLISSEKIIARDASLGADCA
jgi:hypothetical protein